MVPICAPASGQNDPVPSRSRRAALERFLADGSIEIDSNIFERAVRPQTITRKYALVAGSDGGGRVWATIATLLTTAKMNGVDPHAWLTQTPAHRQRLANQPDRRS